MTDLGDIFLRSAFRHGVDRTQDFGSSSAESTGIPSASWLSTGSFVPHSVPDLAAGAHYNFGSAWDVAGVLDPGNQESTWDGDPTVWADDPAGHGVLIQQDGLILVSADIGSGIGDMAGGGLAIPDVFGPGITWLNNDDFDVHAIRGVISVAAGFVVGLSYHAPVGGSTARDVYASIALTHFPGVS